MPNHVERKYHDTDAETGKLTHPSQPAWVTNWIQHRRNSSPQVLHEESSVNDWNFKQVAGKYNRDFGVVYDVPPSSSELGAVPKARKSILTNEKLFVNSEDINNAASEILPFPLLNFNQKLATIWAPSIDQAVQESHTSQFHLDHTLGHGNATIETCHRSTMLGLGPNETSLLGKVICSQREHILQAREHIVATNLSLGRKSLPISRPPQEDLTGSTFTFEQHQLAMGGTATQSITHKKKDTSASGTYAEPKEHLGNTNQSYSKALLYNSNMGRQSDYQISGNSYSGQIEASQLVHDPSVRSLQFPTSIKEKGINTNVFSGSRFLTSHVNPLEMDKPEKLKHGSHSPFIIPMISPYDANRVRMCSTVDSVEGVPGGSLKSVKKFHHLLMTKKTGVDLYKEVGMIRELAAFTRSKGETLTDGEKEDVRDTKTVSIGIKNESSADTDIMDIQIHKKRKPCLGVPSFPSGKDAMESQSSVKYQATLSSSREPIGRKNTEPNLFDLNLAFPSILQSAKPLQNIDLSTSRTASFDGEHIPFHASYQDNFNSSGNKDSLPSMDTSNKCVKRFKSSASDSVVHDTKILRTEDASSVENRSNLFHKNKDYIRTGTEHPLLGKHLGNENMELDNTMKLSRSRGPSSMGSLKDCRYLTLSNSWIRRWCHDQSAPPLISPSAERQSKLHSSKETLDEIPTKQPPSIAAMALMGKTMTGFQECEFTDNGSFVVWNSREV